MAQEMSQITTPGLIQFFDFLDEVVEDEYYVIHYLLYPESMLMIADTTGHTAVTIPHPEEIEVLQSLLSVLTTDGVPAAGESEIVYALTGEQLLQMLG